MLDDRKLEVLKAIVTDYVASREPVGSKALVERHQLDVSAATVRNDMAALEEEPLKGKRVLDYGCGPADFGIWMATESAEVTLLDLSPLAVELGLKRARASEVTRMPRGSSCSAM